MRAWASAQGLPVDQHWKRIQTAALVGRADRESVVAYLEEVTDWRDELDPSHTAAASRDASREYSIAEGRVDQMELEL